MEIGLVSRCLFAFLKAWQLYVFNLQRTFLRPIFHCKRAYSNTYQKDSAEKYVDRQQARGRGVWAPGGINHDFTGGKIVQHFVKKSGLRLYAVWALWLPDSECRPPTPFLPPPGPAERWGSYFNRHPPLRCVASRGWWREPVALVDGGFP